MNRVFDKDPGKALALRLRYTGTSMSWNISDGVLTTEVVGGSGVGISVNLSSYTVSGLCSFLSMQTGYSVPYQDSGSLSGKSALVLLDGSGNQDSPNGDHVHGYTSVLWAYMESVANELTLIRASIAEALNQMSTSTAEGEWLDEHGGYYKVPRNGSELDAAYAARIVAEVIRARGNNIAIGQAIKAAVLADVVSVTDHDEVTIAADDTPSYGLFDVVVESTVDVPLATTEDAVVRQIIEVMRDAGTHLRTMKYIRKSQMVLHLGAVLCVGVNVEISYSPLWLDGSWSLDGSQSLDGVRNQA